jgi:hypothetical protein
MAIPASNNLAPVTQEAFLADRQKFWASLCSATTGSVIAVIILLVLMAVFLV